MQPRLYCDNKFGSGCDYHRIVLPYANNKFAPKENVLIFNRVFSGGADEVRRAKAKGYKIVVDLDDYYELNRDHYLAKHFTEHAKVIIEMVKLADIVTVTTEYLAYKLRHLNRNIVVIRNALPFDELQFTLSQDRTSSTPIVWAGGASHEKDLSLVANSFPGGLFTIAGYEIYPAAKFGSIECLVHSEWAKVMAKFPASNFIKGIRDLNSYMNVYNGHKLVIAPLVGNEFNACKSNLKTLEAGAKGLPIICSKVLPYYNPIDAKVVVYAENHAEWKSEVDKFLKNPTYMEDKGEALAEHVRLHYNLKDANELRRQVVESL
nr:MAG TPA: hypothetical protein [Caudoviricetes sp.]